jgi:hypothetical protein
MHEQQLGWETFFSLTVVFNHKVTDCHAVVGTHTLSSLSSLELQAIEVMGRLGGVGSGGWRR